MIDGVLQIDVRESDFPNEIRTLDYLRFGLHTIATQIWQFEEPIRQREIQAGRSVTFAFGNHHDVDPRIASLLPCLFHWYGVSLCNYARLVGFVTGLKTNAINMKMLQNESGGKAIKNHCDSYIGSVSEITDVLLWRNKVGAHFSITHPYKDDNIATLEMSVMYPTGYANGCFRVNVMALTKTDGGGIQQTSQLPCWSVTETHQTLIARYWKDFSFGPAGTASLQAQ